MKVVAEALRPGAELVLVVLDASEDLLPFGRLRLFVAGGERQRAVKVVLDERNVRHHEGQEHARRTGNVASESEIAEEVRRLETENLVDANDERVARDRLEMGLLVEFGIVEAVALARLTLQATYGLPVGELPAGRRWNVRLLGEGEAGRDFSEDS